MCHGNPSESCYNSKRRLKGATDITFPGICTCDVTRKGRNPKLGFKQNKKGFETENLYGRSLDSMVNCGTELKRQACEGLDSVTGIKSGVAQRMHEEI